MKHAAHILAGMLAAVAWCALLYFSPDVTIAAMLLGSGGWLGHMVYCERAK